MPRLVLTISYYMVEVTDVGRRAPTGGGAFLSPSRGGTSVYECLGDNSALLRLATWNILNDLDEEETQWSVVPMT